jgi:hypothetical protein
MPCECFPPNLLTSGALADYLVIKSVGRWYHCVSCYCWNLVNAICRLNWKGLIVESKATMRWCNETGRKSSAIVCARFKRKYVT